jgi:cytoskeletal protein RodZ
MKINNKKRKSKAKISIISVIILAVILIGGYFVYEKWIKPAPEEGNDNSSQFQSSTISTENEAPNTITEDELKNIEKQEDSQTPVQSTDANGNDNSNTAASSDKLNIEITHNAINSGKLVLRVNIAQLVNTGTCTLTIGNYTATAEVIADPQSSTCQGFDVPTTDFSGKDFKITVKSGDLTGEVKGVINEN